MDMEYNLLRKNCFCIANVSVSPYTIVLHKIDECSCKKGSLKVSKDSWERQQL